RSLTRRNAPVRLRDVIEAINPGGNAARRGHQPAPGELVSALCVRHVDGENVSSHPVRTVRGRYYLSLQGRRAGAGTLGCACGPLRGLQAGAASAEDEDRLLQGCEPARRLPGHPL